jgi:plastocyanin
MAGDMKKKTLLLIILFFLPFFLNAEESELRRAFTEALLADDKGKQVSIVMENKEKIPAEVAAILSITPSVSPQERESLFYIAEMLATIYKDATGDHLPLKEARKGYFESFLSPPVRSTPAQGVHTVDMPKATEGKKNIFAPDNIITKKGEAVEWINSDIIAHIFASMPFIGEGGIFSPLIKPGEKWRFTFEKPGEYHYICFIHRGMVGKVMVEEQGILP